MIQELTNIIEARGLPVYLQGTMTEQEANNLPRYYTYWNFATPDASHYNNRPTRSVCSCWVYLYTIDDPITAQKELDGLIAALRAAGWAVEGKGESASSSLKTHIGRRITARKSENY